MTRSRLLSLSNQSLLRTPVAPAVDGLSPSVGVAELVVSQNRSHHMHSPINLSFRYAEIDYVRALRAHYLSTLRLRRDIVATLILVAFGLYLMRSGSLHWLGVACIVVAAGFAIMLIAAFTVVPPLAFRREPKFRDAYSLEFSSEGIHFRTEHIDSRLQWSMYSRVMIDSHSYVLYYGQRQFTVIPKRVFQSVEQRDAFEHLLSQHVASVVQREKSKAG